VVALNCRGIKVLQSDNSSHRFLRRVNINRQGIGQQQLGRGVDLTITTCADLDRFWGFAHD